MWVMIATMVVSLLLSAALAPGVPQTTNTPAAEGDFEFPQADEGTPQAVIFGECWTSDWTVLAVGNYRTTQIMSDGAGK